ncbi:hypothetical protein SADUNF_Sadunf14G0049700 [Salix dunnii]|uniref:Uncharacterized protein n=1 Tax=Salix dunnii TaxID=1413687 RepID=A0A835JHQ3_9ROSI|nr:hypothetical protein SADUNF_Sadunf14G0049700 [Salix dunnii]
MTTIVTSSNEFYFLLPERIDGILPMSPTLLSHLMFQCRSKRVKCQLIMAECSSRESPKENMGMKIGNKNTASESSALKEKLEILIEVSETADGCADLSSKNLLSVVLQLITQLNLCIKGLTVILFQIVVSQVLAIVSLAGKEHQQAIWGGLFHHVFPMIAKVRSRETRLPVVTASLEEWMKLLIFRISLDEIHFPELFSKLYYRSIDLVSRGKVDLLLDRSAVVELHGLVDFVDTLLSSGLIELPFGFLHNLETPAIIRTAMKQADNPETTTTCTPKFRPYKRSRRDGCYH